MVTLLVLETPYFKRAKALLPLVKGAGGIFNGVQKCYLDSPGK
jgi:hypothetical protein